MTDAIRPLEWLPDEDGENWVAIGWHPRSATNVFSIALEMADCHGNDVRETFPQVMAGEWSMRLAFDPADHEESAWFISTWNGSWDESCLAWCRERGIEEPNPLETMRVTMVRPEY